MKNLKKSTVSNLAKQMITQAYMFWKVYVVRSLLSPMHSSALFVLSSFIEFKSVADLYKRTFHERSSWEENRTTRTNNSKISLALIMKSYTCVHVDKGSNSFFLYLIEGFIFKSRLAWFFTKFRFIITYGIFSVLVPRIIFGICEKIVSSIRNGNSKYPNLRFHRPWINFSKILYYANLSFHLKRR